MSNVKKPHSGVRDLLPKVGKVRNEYLIRQSALGTPCKTCGHSDLAHDDRYGVMECLVQNCLACRDTSWVRLEAVKKTLQVGWVALTEALFQLRETVPVTLDPEDHECIRKTDVACVNRQIGKAAKIYLTDRGQ